MHSSRNTIIAIGLLLGCAVAASEAIAQGDLLPYRSLPEQLQQGQAPAANDTAKEVVHEEHRDAQVNKDDEAKQKLKAFFEEMEGLLDAKDKFGEVAKEIQKELKAEFQQNERLLKSGDVGSRAAEAAELEDRQKVIAQYVIELESRSRTMDPSQHFELRRRIQNGFRDFRRANPKLAEKPEFQQRERDLMNQAMQRMRGFDPRRGQQATMAETMRSLSADGTEEAAKPLTNAAHPGEQEGAIQQLRTPLRKLLRLKWDDEQLTLDRDHWDTAFAGQTADDIRVDVDHLLEQKGVPPNRENDERRVQLLRARMPDGMQNSNVERLFHELRGTHSGRFSRSASGSSVDLSFNNGSVQARMKSSPEQFELMIEELASPSRVLRLVDSRQSGMQIMLIGDLVHRFLQQPQRVSVVEILDDEVITLKAKSFARLYREQPRFVEERLFALLDHVGIIPPASRFDRQIVNRLMENLAADKARLRQEVDRLLTELDGDRFTKRDAAYKALQAGLEDYYEMLYAKQAGDSLSREVRARIRKLLDMKQAKGVSHVDAVIAALGLEKDRPYLEELRDIVDKPAQQMIDQRLQQLSAE